MADFNPSPFGSDAPIKDVHWAQAALRTGQSAFAVGCSALFLRVISARRRTEIGYSVFDNHPRPAWNVGRKIGSKRALKQKEVWAIRFWLEQEGRMRDRALFDLATDSKLRGCDFVRIRIGDLASGTAIRDRALVVQRKTGKPVQFEILEPARTTLLARLERRGGSIDDYAFPSRCSHSAHLSTRQYSRLVDEWVSAIG
jgi:hypothetical protein